MKMLACFLLFSMMGGAAEVIFIGAHGFIKGRSGQTEPKLPASSASTCSQRLPATSSAGVMESNAMGPEPNRL